MPVRTLASTFAFAVLVTACGSSSPTPTQAQTIEPNGDSGGNADGDAVIIDNQGGNLEGHTPRGFAGSGTGLFAGDELNPGFPADDGIQIWLSFDLPATLQKAPATAELRSDALDPRATPFDDLGDLTVAAVSYPEFGPHLFDLEAISAEVACTRPTGRSLRCDVTDALTDAIDAANSRLQLRLRFDQLSDGDGTADLARFFLTEPNTNEPGIFTLVLNP